jgi:hypothetical protein
VKECKVPVASKRMFCGRIQKFAELSERALKISNPSECCKESRFVVVFLLSSGRHPPSHAFKYLSLQILK